MSFDYSLYGKIDVVDDTFDYSKYLTDYPYVYSSF